LLQQVLLDYVTHQVTPCIKESKKLTLIVTRDEDVSQLRGTTLKFERQAVERQPQTLAHILWPDQSNLSALPIR
jgi:hypothetical protein